MSVHGDRLGAAIIAECRKAIAANPSSVVSPKAIAARVVRNMTSYNLSESLDWVNANAEAIFSGAAP